LSPDPVFGKSSFQVAYLRIGFPAALSYRSLCRQYNVRFFVCFPEWIEKTEKLSDVSKYKGDFMKPMLLDFSATWCGPCRMQKPILEELEKKYGDKVEFKVVDVDENQEMASKYGIHAVPTLIIQKDGTEVKRFMGVTQGSVLASELDKLL
jgi:thioredoxin 1